MSRSSRRDVATLLMLLALALPASCRRSAKAPPTPVLVDVRVQDVSASDRTVRANPDAVREQLLQHLRSVGLFQGAVGAAPDAPRAEVKVRYQAESVEFEARGLATAQVSLAIETTPENAPGALNGDWRGAAERKYEASPAPAGGASAVLTSLVAQTAAQLADEVAAGERLRRASPTEIHAILSSPQAGEQRRQAIRIVAARRMTQEVPALLALLEDPDEMTRDTALGALIELRERRAVPVLTKSRSLRDAREMRKVIEALSVIGGPEAHSFLEFVAETNDSTELRRLAADARDRLDRRAAADAH